MAFFFKKQPKLNLIFTFFSYILKEITQTIENKKRRRFKLLIRKELRNNYFTKFPLSILELRKKYKKKFKKILSLKKLRNKYNKKPHWDYANLKEILKSKNNLKKIK